MPDEPPRIIDYADRAPVWVGGGRRWSMTALFVGTVCFALCGLTVVVFVERIRHVPSMVDGVATVELLMVAVPSLIAGGGVLARLDPERRRGAGFLMTSLVALGIALVARLGQALL